MLLSADRVILVTLYASSSAAWRLGGGVGAGGAIGRCRGGGMAISGDMGGRPCCGWRGCPPWMGDCGGGATCVERWGENLSASLRSIEDPRTPRALLTSEM